MFMDYNFEGSHLLDEMQLSPSLALNQRTLEINGFINLGKYTPENQTSQKGDHALVLMFQPFKGKWLQSFACYFLLPM